VTVARAKRTARAEARRRHRADQGFVETIEPERSTERSTQAAPAITSRPTPAAPGARRGIVAAFRDAFRPLDVRGDLQALPTIALRSKALWIPIALTLASTALFAAVRPGGGQDVSLFGRLSLSLIASFLFTYFIVTPAIGAVFIAGFLAPRASWLLGVIVGLVSAACYSFLGLGGFIPLAPNAPQPRSEDVVIAAFALSPVLGALFASTAAWYRRFLMLTNPNRGRPRQGASSSRRPDGRSRAGNSGQKAGARR
jgi:hypothetical protein